MDSLPSYRKPPVNEVVCGVRFHASDKLYIPHIGLLWDRFKGTRSEDQVPVLILELKVLGIDNSAKKEGIRNWFNLSHEWIVRGFADLTTPEIHELWEREDNE